MWKLPRAIIYAHCINLWNITFRFCSRESSENCPIFTIGAPPEREQRKQLINDTGFIIICNTEYVIVSHECQNIRFY